MTLTVRRCTGQVFCRLFLSWALLDVFLTIRLRVVGVGEADHRDEVPSYHVVSMWLSTDDVDFGHLAKIAFIRFLQCKVIISVFVPFTLYSLESSHTVYSPHLWSRKLGSPSLGGVLKVLKEKKLFRPLFAPQVQWVSPFSFLPPRWTVNWGVGIYLS